MWVVAAVAGGVFLYLLPIAVRRERDWHRGGPR